MKNIKLVAAISALLLSSCTYRLVDFTVITTKNAEIGVDRAKGKATEGSHAYFLGLGFNLKDALDEALEMAGPQYDLLIDGVVSYQALPFVSVVKVKGIAVSSSTLKASLGEDGYKQWIKAKNVFEPSTVEKSEE